MMVDVRLTDGHTTFRFLARGQVMRLFKRDPGTLDENESVFCWAWWHRDSDGWEPARIQFIKKHSVAFVRQVEHAERDEFLAALPEEQKPRSMRTVEVPHPANPAEVAALERQAAGS